MEISIEHGNIRGHGEQKRGDTILCGTGPAPVPARASCWAVRWRTASAER